MDLFRKNQKVIFWIVTIIIVPSFVLVWGAGGFFDSQPHQQQYAIGTVNGKNISYQDFEAFRKRIAAATGGIPLQFTGAPSGTAFDDLYKFMFIHTLLQDAEKAGANASDLQIGTYIQYGHPTIPFRIDRNDPKSVDRAVDELCRQMSMSRQEFLQGVREWQTLGNYIIADANLTAVNNDTIYAFYAFNRAQLDIKRIRVVPTDSINEQARAAVMEKPAGDLDAEIRLYATTRANDPDNQRYRQPSAWRFEYLFEPNVADDSVRQPTEEEMMAQYEPARASVFDNKPFEEVRDDIRAELLKLEVDRQTLRNFNIDIDEQLRNENGAADLDELVKLTPIAKYAVTAGNTGENALALPELLKQLPEGSDSEMRLILEMIDSMPLDTRNLIINEWKSGFQLNLRPFKAEDGYFRLRLLEYNPSAPAVIDDADGKIVPEIYELALADMITDKVDELVREQALAMEQRLRQYSEAKETGKAVDETLEQELAALPVETLTYEQIADNLYDLGRLVVGDVYGPAPYRNDAIVGQELLLLVDRRIPSRADFETETPETKTSFKNLALSNFRGNVGFSFTLEGPNAVIQPSPAILGGIISRFANQQITINPELLRENEA